MAHNEQGRGWRELSKPKRDELAEEEAQNEFFDALGEHGEGEVKRSLPTEPE